jgi:ABC-type transporter Mla MlaB component
LPGRAVLLDKPQKGSFMVDRREPPLTQEGALGPRPEASALVFVISGSITPADVERICNRLRALAEGNGAPLVICDVAAVGDPDVATVDALAQLQLTARRLGRQIVLRNACDELRQLLFLVGLSDVVLLAGGSQPGGKGEEREQTRGVEKRVDPGDSPG